MAAKQTTKKLEDQLTCDSHQLHIKVEEEEDYHIIGPFLALAKLPVEPCTPLEIISEVNCPSGAALNQKRELIVSETSYISIYSQAGERLQTFGSQGSGDGQFDRPHGVAVDDDGNILVVDAGNFRIQKLSSDGQFIAAVGKEGKDPLEFNDALGIAISPLNKKLYIADASNHHIQILNPDLTFFSCFGSQGGDNGHFQSPYDVVIDSTGTVYVADSANHRIQVFSAEGEYLRKFGEKGSGSGELSWPSGIYIDTDNLVYVTDIENCSVSVFTSEGQSLTSFGEEGSGPGQFYCPHGIAVDKNGVIYVCDTSNNRLQYF